MHILIGVPSYPGFIKSDCVAALMDTQRALLKQGHDVDFGKNQPADVVLARNIFGSLMLGSRFTHLLFSDNDMDFKPATPLRLLKADKPVIGCIYRKKRPDPVFAVRTLKGQTELTITEGFCQPPGIGMGLCLIQKTAFETMAATKKLRTSARDGGIFKLNGPLYGFFDPIPDEDGELLPEDYSFCERWRTLCGGDVWADASANIGHIGDCTYRGSYLDHLKQRSTKV